LRGFDPDPPSPVVACSAADAPFFEAGTISFRQLALGANTPEKRI